MSTGSKSVFINKNTKAINNCVPQDTKPVVNNISIATTTNYSTSSPSATTAVTNSTVPSSTNLSSEFPGGADSDQISNEQFNVPTNIDIIPSNPSVIPNAQLNDRTNININTSNPRVISEETSSSPRNLRTSITGNQVTKSPCILTRSAQLGPASRTRSSYSSTSSLEMRQRKILEESIQFALNNGQQTKQNGDPLPPGKMAITIRDMDGQSIEFYVRPQAPFSPIFHRFADFINRTRSEVRFLCDGDRLVNSDSPASKDMISGEAIDCMWSAIGGFYFILFS